MAQTANSQRSQTLHVESEQTLSTQSQKLPTQLNTLNRFFSELVRVPKCFRRPTVGPVCFHYSSGHSPPLSAVCMLVPPLLVHHETKHVWWFMASDKKYLQFFDIMAVNLKDDFLT